MAGRICRLAQQEENKGGALGRSPWAKAQVGEAAGQREAGLGAALGLAGRSKRGMAWSTRGRALLDLKQRGCRGSRAVMVLTAMGSGRRGPWRDAGAGTGQRRGAATLARSLEPDEANEMARDLARGRRIQAAACPARTWRRRFLAAETTEREREL